jgi:hypothetical protein
MSAPGLGGFVPVDFEGGTIRPVYVDDGSGGHELVTMFPEPAAGKHPRMKSMNKTVEDFIGTRLHVEMAYAGMEFDNSETALEPPE